MTRLPMTKGNILKQLLLYSLPLILGNLFQLTYNTIDSIIVGKFIGKEALAAVGTANPVMNIIILGISGICIASSVIMSEFFGAKDEEMVKKEMATTSVFGVYFSIIIALVGMLVTRPLLRFLQVPIEIQDTAAIYLRLTFIGAPFTFFYNAIAAALKSIGDSTTPLKFLAFASILNGLLDIILIGVFGFGIPCSALTTVLAQAVSAILCIRYIYRNTPILQVKRNEFRITPSLLKLTLSYGSVTALQQSVQPIGKLLIQAAINPMGVSAIAAFNAVNRIDDYAFTPEQSISHGMTTFLAQNRGAKEYGRIRKGLKAGLLLEFLYWIIICVTITLLKEPLLHLFSSKEDQSIVLIGSSYLSIMAVFYLLPAFTNGMQGYFRGMGKMKITLIATTIQTSLRVLFVYLLTPHFGILGVAYACAIGWSIMLLYEFAMYVKIQHE